MGYLEQNQTLIKELRQNTHFVRGHTVAVATRFTSIGSYHSNELGQQVYVGLKEYVDPTKNLSTIRTRMVEELAAMCICLRKLPNIYEQLPLFHGLLVGNNDQPIGIITEDFSRGGTVSVRADRGPHQDLRDALEDGDDLYIDADQVPFSIEGRRRLGDFYPVSIYAENSDIVEAIEQAEDNYTVRVNYTL